MLLNVRNLSGRTVGEVAFDVIRKVIRSKAEISTLEPLSDTIILETDEHLEVDGIGEVVSANGVEVFAYKLANNIYQIDISDGVKEKSIVLINPSGVIKLWKTPAQLNYELSTGEIAIPPKMSVVSSYKSGIDRLPLVIHELEGEKHTGVAKYSEKSGVIAIEVWPHGFYKSLSFISF